jgi:hypothetical protein
MLMAGAAFTVSPPASDALPAITAADCLAASGASPQRPRPAVDVTVEAVVGPRGEQVGRRLELRTSRGSQVSVALASDSFVGQPTGDRLLYAQRLASGGSEVRALSIATGCDRRLVDLGDVVRSVVQSPLDGALYVHTVREPERRDGGVTRIDPETGASEQVLPPFEPSAEFGLVYSTQLAWAADGQALVVQSCGIEDCVSRTVDPEGTVTTYDAPQGALVGMTANELITFAPDHGRPAGLLAIDRLTGIVRIVADEVFDAQLTDASPATLLIETSAGRLEVLP